jgi:phage shock protein PspC (stress-responsive transcriptional regulator)
MTALANSPVFWTGLLAGLAALYDLPTMIAVIRNAGTIALVVFLNCFPVTWPAALVIACMMPRKEPW